jgi:CheY-like chemotaxis protein
MLAASPDIGMFISDLMLPGSLSGAEVINHVRSHYPQLPVLLISGQDLRPAHNLSCRTFSYCASRLRGCSWRRRCKVMVI